jgi:RNA polymerase sigma factor (sigma-70 family)
MRNQDSFGPYLNKTVVNLAKMQFRRKGTERRYLLQHHDDRARTTDQVRSSDDDLRVALARLPYRQRAAVVLRFYSDFPDEETARILGCSPGTVRSLISRGVAALRDQMGADRVG